MKICAELFKKKLESQNFNFDTSELEDGDIYINFPYSGKFAKLFFAGDDGEYMSMYFLSERVPAEKKNDLILLCNKLHRDYKWITFYVDEDNDLMLHLDAILCPENAAEVAFELLVRMVKIYDEVKPEIMKAIYA